MTISILATGDELTHGDTLNTTTQVLAHALSVAGFSMGMHLTCGDKEAEIKMAIGFLAKEHKVLILTGGLGPTSDDRTRFALASFLNLSLKLNQQALQSIEQYLKKDHLEMTSGQKSQALFPDNVILFENRSGTANGCVIHVHEHLFILLPGPPSECIPMFEASVLPYLKQHLQPSDKVCLKWRLYGVPEGAVAEKLEQLLSDMPCQLGYRLAKEAMPAYLEFKVRCMPEWVSRVRAIIDPFVKGYPPDERH